MLNYIIRKAKSIENSPTIVLIHGYGSNAEDLFSFKPYLPENYNIIAIQAPLTLSYNSYAWYPLYPKNDGTFDSKIEEAYENPYRPVSYTHLTLPTKRIV